MTTYEIRQRLAGTRQAYWTLRVFQNGKETPIAVHSGKGQAGYRYVSNIQKVRYPDAKKI
jgi:hypothetical protein